MCFGFIWGLWWWFVPGVSYRWPLLTPLIVGVSLGTGYCFLVRSSIGIVVLDLALAVASGVHISWENSPWAGPRSDSTDAVFSEQPRQAVETSYHELTALPKLRVCSELLQPPPRDIRHSPPCLPCPVVPSPHQTHGVSPETPPDASLPPSPVSLPRPA